MNVLLVKFDAHFNYRMYIGHYLKMVKEQPLGLGITIIILKPGAFFFLDSLLGTLGTVITVMHHECNAVGL